MRHHRVSRRAAAIALALAAGAAQAEAPFSFAATPGKLPKDVIPLLYDAHLVPDFGNDSFKGSQTVEIEVLRPTARIVLNAANLVIERAAIEGRDLARQTLQPLVDEASQTVSFQLAAPLTPGRYALALGFRGQINREGRGLFGVSYMAGGADRKLVATLLAPADARRLLPTWDEPAFRARFRLTVDLPPSFQAYSNTPVEKRETLADGRQRISFAPTPNMPSYLMALVAGELERAQARRGGVEIGVVTTEGKLGSTAFPLAATGDLLRYYNNYFGIPYPLPKLDQIAIPGGFYGAMESWGGIVYNEALLLVDPKKSPEGTTKLSFGANAHELAHQWFGNLVTMAWWDNLWLNEGFASWMAAKATEHFHPEWRPYLDEIAQREKVLDLDAQEHPPDPDPDRERGAGRQRLRRHHLHQEQGLPAHARGLRRRRPFPQGLARLHGGAQVLEYHLERPVGGAREGLGQAGRQGRIGLDLAAGLSADFGEPGVRERQAQGDRVAGTVPPRRTGA